MRVLVVEDELSVAEIVRDVVTELGHGTRLVATAEAGLSVLASDPFDAVLLDLLLPRMTGLDFLRSGIVRDCGIPVIGYSGVATEAQVRATLQLGAVDVLEKPVPVDLMREMLDYVRFHAVSQRNGIDRRRSPRPHLEVPVRVLEYEQPEWVATSLNLSIFGIRIRGRAPRMPGRLVKLWFTPPDGGADVQVLALPVWRDVGTHAFRFVNLGVATYERLRHVVWRLAA
jgi:CheY-like chemotaxis protein